MGTVPATNHERGYPDHIWGLDNLETGLCYNPKWLPGADRVRLHVSSSPVSYRHHLVAAWATIIITAGSGGALATLLAVRGFG